MSDAGDGESITCVDQDSIHGSHDAKRTAAGGTASLTLTGMIYVTAEQNERGYGVVGALSSYISNYNLFWVTPEIKFCCTHTFFEAIQSL